MNKLIGAGDMKKLAVMLAVMSGFAFAQEQKPLDPCGSPKETYSKYLLDKCYKGYFDAIVESKKLAEEALKKAKDLEGRVQKLEGIADNHEKRIKALEERPMPTPKEEKWQLEEVGVVHFGFGKFNIKSAEAKKLDDMVEKLKGESKEILIVGFADTRGSSKYNFNLSMWRAQMVASYLAKKGVDIGKIKMAAYGKEVANILGSKHAEQRAVKIYLVK